MTARTELNRVDRGRAAARIVARAIGALAIGALTLTACGPSSGTDAKTKGDAPTSDATADGRKDAPTAAPQFSDDVERAATIAREIMAAPESADAILAKYDLDRAGLDALIYSIASDPASRERYAAKLAEKN